MINPKILELLGQMHPVNAAIAFALYTNKAESILELARMSPDQTPDWVRILANAEDPTIIDWAIYDLSTEPGWAELMGGDNGND